MQAKLRRTSSDLGRVSHTWSRVQRKLGIESALALVSAANASLGSGMTYDIGAGHLLF